MGKRKKRQSRKPSPGVVPEAVEEVGALERATDVDALAALASSDDRAHRNLARKALYRLKQRGVAVPDATRAPSRVRAARNEELPPSVVTAVDGRGQRVVFLVRSAGVAGVEVAQAVVSDIDGVLDLQIHTTSRTAWRKVSPDLVADGELAAAPVEADVAAAVLRSALATDPTVPAVRSRLSDLLPMLRDAEPLSDPHPVYALVDEAPEDAPVDEDPAVFEVAPVDAWVPPEPALVALVSDLDRVANGLLVLNDAQKAEQLEVAIDKATNGWFDETNRARYRRRLEDSAFVLALRGDTQAARRLLAAGRALALDKDASSIAWCRAFFARWLRTGDDEASDEEARSEGGIVLPGA